jgi:hypothetical protein
MKNFLLVAVLAFFAILIFVFLKQDVIQRSNNSNDTAVAVIDYNSIPIETRLTVDLKVTINDEGYLVLENKTEAYVSDIHILIKDMSNSLAPTNSREVVVDNISKHSKNTLKEFGIMPILTHRRKGMDFFFFERGSPEILAGYKFHVDR